MQNIFIQMNTRGVLATLHFFPDNDTNLVMRNGFCGLSFATS